MKIKKGDKVKIIKGKDSGKTGKVLKVFSEKNKVLVEGLNIYKKHLRPKKQGEKGEIIALPKPLSASNVMLDCSSCGKAVRVGYLIENGKKTRICKKCHAPVDK